MCEEGPAAPAGGLRFCPLTLEGILSGAAIPRFLCPAPRRCAGRWGLLSGLPPARCCAPRAVRARRGLFRLATPPGPQAAGSSRRRPPAPPQGLRLRAGAPAPRCHEGGGPGAGRSPLQAAPRPAGSQLATPVGRRPHPAPGAQRRGQGARGASGGQRAAHHPARHRRGGGGRGRPGGRHPTESRVSEHPCKPWGTGEVCAPHSRGLLPPAFPASGCPERYRPSPWAGFSFPRQYARGREAHLHGQERWLARGCVRRRKERRAGKRSGFRVEGDGSQSPARSAGRKLSRPHLGMLRERSRGPEGAQGMASLSRYRRGPSHRCV